MKKLKSSFLLISARDSAMVGSPQSVTVFLIIMLSITRNLTYHYDPEI